MTPAEHATLARVGVLIVNYNASEWLARAVTALRPPGSDEPEIVIVDNGSTDQSLETLRAALGDRAAEINIDRAGVNLGFAAGINRAARQTGRELLLLLNPDCRIEPATLARLVAELDAHPEAALVAGKVLGLDRREQRGSRRLRPTPARIFHELSPISANGIDLTHTQAPESACEVEAVSGACMLIRACDFNALEGLDTAYPLHFEDLDLFARLAESGRTLRWVPEAVLEHVGGASSGSRPAGVLIDKHRGLWRYLGRHCGDQWPLWQRPLWAIAMTTHLAIRLALITPALLRARWRQQ